MVKDTPAAVKVHQICVTGGMDLYLDERGTGRKGCGAAFPSCPALCGYRSVFISFAFVGRHFPKNIALQSENPSR